MKRIISIAAGGLIAALATFPASAHLMTVSGPLSQLGDMAAIIDPPDNVNDDEAYNTAMEGFDEMQSVMLGAPLSIDNGGNIAANTLIDSHMIFLNTGPGDIGTANSHFEVLWTFDGEVLGVMSNSNGSLEVNSSGDLGAAGTIYPLASFNARGLENANGGNGGFGPFPNDGYTIGFSGANTLLVGMSVTEPGDWIRVITRAVPEPTTALLLGLGLVGLGLRRRRMH